VLKVTSDFEPIISRYPNCLSSDPTSAWLERK
jgi:hypothetical protein